MHKEELFIKFLRAIYTSTSKNPDDWPIVVVEEQNMHPEPEDQPVEYI